MELVLILSYSSLGFLVISTTILALRWREYYVIYNHRLLFVVGLLISRSLTNSAVISVLMWYFAYYEGDLVTSAVLSNIQESLSSLFVLFMAHSADSFVGRFRTVLFSNTAYIGGLMLLWMFNPYDVKWLIVVALVLLALGTSGDYLLDDILIDLVNDIDKSQDRTKDIDKSQDWIEKRSRARATIWSRMTYVSGAISAIMWVVPGAVGGVTTSWRSSFLICLITMTASLMIFCKGHNEYDEGELTERPVEMFFRVFCTRIQKLLKSISRYLTNTARQDGSTQNIETEKRDNEGMTQERSDIVVVKKLLNMFPMWGMYFVLSLISATGSTFFLEQYSNLNTNEIPIQFYTLLQELSGFAIPYLYCWSRCFGTNEKVKIGAGMICAIISCVFAWQLEVHRLRAVDHLPVYDQDENTSISFLWLVPQFCVLGCMEGLTKEGLLNFYGSQIKIKPISYYGEEYIEVMRSLGKMLNIFLILIFKSRVGWFSNTINESRLDKYYILLVCVCSANFIIYCCIAKFFYVEKDKDDAQQEHLAPECKAPNFRKPFAIKTCLDNLCVML